MLSSDTKMKSKSKKTLVLEAKSCSNNETVVSGKIYSGGCAIKKNTLALCLVLVISLSSSSSWVAGLQWESVDNDSIVVEAAPIEDQELQSLDHGSRKKRQFSGFPFQFPGGGGISGFPQFPPGWPFIQGGRPGSFPGFPSFPSAPTPAPTPTPTTPSQICKTRRGIEGRCIPFRQCYPVVYSSLEGEDEEFRNPVLAAQLRQASGPCDTHTMPNYLIFRADAEFRQNLICCGGSSGDVSNPPVNPPQSPTITDQFTHPQITMRPPWAQMTSTTTSTTTTTPSPWPPAIQTQRTTSSTSNPLYPNWPPPIPTHPPNHTPATWGPPQSQYPTAAPPTQWTQWTQWTQATRQPNPTLSPSIPSHRPTPSPVAPPPSVSSCGFTKIVGGTTATKGEFPWLVALMKNGRQFCGGSLIDSQWILSAAHCFQHFQGHDVANIRVQIGDYDIYSNSDGPVTIKGVSKMIRHSGFSHQTLHNDIALLKLDSPVQFGSNGNNNIQPICLAQSGGYEGGTAIVAGWGGVYENGPQPSTYRKVDLPIWNNPQCAAKYGHYAPGGITSHMVCAGMNTKDACRGDSGGPLMRNNGGRFEQIGLVSWGIGCGKYPGVYTRLDHFRDWIARNRAT